MQQIHINSLWRPNYKEEGTFTILSTSKVANYADLSKHIPKVYCTKWEQN